LYLWSAKQVAKYFFAEQPKSLKTKKQFSWLTPNLNNFQTPTQPKMSTTTTGKDRVKQTLITDNAFRHEGV
jgi:hypothetical protein